MKQIHFPILLILLTIGCGSIPDKLAAGKWFYSDLPKPEVEKVLATGKYSIKSLQTSATGCLASSLESVESEIITPALQKELANNKAFAINNVKGVRMIAPTVMDAVTGAFIWACSYWELTGDLLITQ